jgi:hypothetical protein
VLYAHLFLSSLKALRILDGSELSPQVQRSPAGSGTPFGFHLLSASQNHGTGFDNECFPDMEYISRRLPPRTQARELFSHFLRTMQPTFGVLHIPSTQALMEQIYESMLEGEEPSSTNLVLLLSIFAGAALVWTPQLLEKLSATSAEAKAAFASYGRLAISILDNIVQPVAPSTVALEAIITLTHVLSNADGFPDKVQMLRTRALFMARAIQIHRLDTVKNSEERRLEECNMVEIEVQRRIWWHMVSSDWCGLSASFRDCQGLLTVIGYSHSREVPRKAHIYSSQSTLM